MPLDIARRGAGTVERAREAVVERRREARGIHSPAIGLAVLVEARQVGVGESRPVR